MKKFNKKIHKTIDYQHAALCTARYCSLLLVSLIIWICLLIYWINEAILVGAIFHCGIVFCVASWYIIQLIKLRVKSNMYKFCESSEFDIAENGRLNKLFAIKINIGEKTYISSRIININDYVRAKEQKKIEIGIIDKNGESEIVVMKPN